MSSRGLPNHLFDWEWNTDAMPALKEGEVSAPTSSDATYRALWQFTASGTGWLSIDALLSHFPERADGAGEASTTLTIYQWNTNGYWSYLDSSSNYTFLDGEGVPRGRLLPQLTAGTKYIIGVQAGAPDVPVNMVVRISNEYADWQEWVQPPIQRFTFGVLGYGGTSYAHVNIGNIPQTVTPVPAQVWDQNTQAYVTRTTDAMAGAVSHNIKQEYRSGYELWRTFAGPPPGEETDAIQCCWSWARRMRLGASWWDDAGGWPGYETFGWVGGPGVCPNFTHTSVMDRQFGNTETWRTGYYYRSTPWQIGGYQDIWFHCYGSSFGIDVERLETILGGTGLGYGAIDVSTTYGRPGSDPSKYLHAPFTPTLTPYSQDKVEWENNRCEVVKLALAPDENKDHADNVANNLTVNWYIETGKTVAEETARPWGPQRGPGPSGYLHDWNGSPAGPESFVGSQTLFATYSGGASSWWEVPDEMLEAGRAARRQRVGVRPPSWPSPSAGSDAYYTANVYEIDLRVTCLASGIFESTPPSELGNTVGLDISTSAYRRGSGVAVRVDSMPARYRVFRDPGVPDITWTDGEGELDPISDGRLFL